LANGLSSSRGAARFARRLEGQAASVIASHRVRARPDGRPYEAIHRAANSKLDCVVTNTPNKATFQTGRPQGSPLRHVVPVGATLVVARLARDLPADEFLFATVMPWIAWHPADDGA